MFGTRITGRGSISSVALRYRLLCYQRLLPRQGFKAADNWEKKLPISLCCTQTAVLMCFPPKLLFQGFVKWWLILQYSLCLNAF